MRNYFNHEFKVKFSTQTMSKEKDFQWVVEEMENEFEYPEIDIQNLDEYFSIVEKFNRHINYFIRIYEIDKIELKIENKFLNVISNIARFAIKNKTLTNVIRNNEYKNFSVLYLLGLIGGRLKRNKINIEYDLSIFIFYNYFELNQIKNMSKENKNTIEKLLKNLNIAEKNKILDVYYKNFNEHHIEYNEINLKVLKKYNKLFNNYGYKRNLFLTWQEDYILEMANLSFSITDIIPEFSSGKYNFPNYDLWNEKIINNMKKFFSNNFDASIILEIINYRLNNNKINNKIQKIVFNRVLNIIKNKTEIYNFNNIWFYIVIKQMNQRESYIKENINKIYIELNKKRNIKIILFLQEKNFTINKVLQRKIDNYYIKEIKKIDEIKDLHKFTQLLKDKYIKKNINFKILISVMNKFFNLIKERENDRMIPHTFYYIINFLILAKEKENNHIINEYIFKVLKIWNEDYYKQIYAQMEEIKYINTIKKEQIEKENNYFIKHPVDYFRKNFLWDNKYLLNQIINASEYAVLPIITKKTINIDEFLPYIKNIELNKKKSFDSIVVEYINEMKMKYSEQLLNKDIDEIFILNLIYMDYSDIIYTFINIIYDNNYKIIYEYMKDKFSKFNLLPYSDEVNIAHATQLIPILELLIRELGVKNNIVPFKEKEYQIHVMKDSSTILLSIIREKFKLNNNFENIEIYLYLYNFLYNSSSLNIRNELIHARRFLENKSEIKFAFRVLIVAIFWSYLELQLE